MANNLSLCLIAVMDRLWFQQIILFPENKLEPKQPYLEATANTTTTTSSTLSSPSLSSAADQQEPAPEEQVKKRSRRGNHSRSHSSSSSSPPAQKRDKRMNNQCKLRKSTSFRSLKDLELEEVKGFMDLGFVFTKEHLNPTMIRVVPGLLRLEFPRTKRMESTEVDGIEQEKKRVVIRPYLSEAWLIKRPDSPLLNLRVPRVSAAADMKKHLKFWARTVASVVQQES